MKMKTLSDFQICISVPLKREERRTWLPKGTLLFNRNGYLQGSK